MNVYRDLADDDANLDPDLDASIEKHVRKTDRERLESLEGSRVRVVVNYRTPPMPGQVKKNECTFTMEGTLLSSRYSGVWFVRSDRNTADGQPVFAFQMDESIDDGILLFPDSIDVSSSSVPTLTFNI